MRLDPQEVMEEAYRLSKEAASMEQKKPDPPVVTVEDPSPVGYVWQWFLPRDLQVLLGGGGVGMGGGY